MTCLKAYKFQGNKIAKDFEGGKCWDGCKTWQQKINEQRFASKSSAPESRSLTSIRVALASKEFSTSSFTHASIRASHYMSHTFTVSFSFLQRKVMLSHAEKILGHWFNQHLVCTNLVHDVAAEPQGKQRNLWPCSQSTALCTTNNIKISGPSLFMEARFARHLNMFHDAKFCFAHCWGWRACCTNANKVVSEIVSMSWRQYKRNQGPATSAIHDVTWTECSIDAPVVSYEWHWRLQFIKFDPKRQQYQRIQHKQLLNVHHLQKHKLSAWFQKKCKNKSVSAPFSNVKAYVKGRNAVPVSRPTTPTLHAPRSPRSQPSHFDKGPCSNAAFRTSKMGRKSRTAKIHTGALLERMKTQRNIFVSKNHGLCFCPMQSYQTNALFV